LRGRTGIRLQSKRKGVDRPPQCWSYYEPFEEQANDCDHQCEAELPAISQPKDISYLAFEGGGGKGVAYLGAVMALEELGVLPINKPGSNQILGISGASAGAITAFLLALGYGSKKIQQLLSDPARFNAFFDEPQPGFYRGVDRAMKPVARNDSPNLTGADLLQFIRERRAKVDIEGFFDLLRNVVVGYSSITGAISGGVGGAFLGGFTGLTLCGFLSLAASSKFNSFVEQSKDPILTAMSKNLPAFIYNLVFDRGLFPGFAVRNFLRSILADYIGTRALKRTGLLVASGTSAATFNFEQLYRETGVDLVFTGANVTQKRPKYFSVQTTPKFPVIEAVAISMNLPILFKPVYIDALDDYQGYWVDGGLLNNLPLHAFDEARTNPLLSDDPNLRPLHPGILGLRLTPGFEDPKQNDAAISAVAGTFDALTHHLGDVFETILAPSEEGQIRTPAEREQTIDLYTENLATTEFAPPQEKSQGPVEKARRKIYDYLKMSAWPSPTDS
jgi:predicted acylesterase/phospholipase RssA